MHFITARSLKQSYVDNTCNIYHQQAPYKIFKSWKRLLNVESDVQSGRCWLVLSANPTWPGLKFGRNLPFGKCDLKNRMLSQSLTSNHCICIPGKVYKLAYRSFKCLNRQVVPVTSANKTSERRSRMFARWCLNSKLPQEMFPQLFIDAKSCNLVNTKPVFLLTFWGHSEDPRHGQLSA